MKITGKHIPAYKIYSLSLTDEDIVKLYKSLEEGQTVLDKKLREFVDDLLELLRRNIK